jgi:putative transposase
MVAAVRAGESQRSVARRFGVRLSRVQHWVERAGERELDAVDWDDRSSAPRRPARTPLSMERRVLQARAFLRDKSVLGEFGAVAIEQYLRNRYDDAPSVRTVGRILKRRGALDGKPRVRRPPPRPGWYLPEVAAGRAELDSFDTVMGLVIADGPEVEVLNGVSLHGGVVGSWPSTRLTAIDVAGFLVEHWRKFGLPRYAQFDNDTRFQGAHQFRDSIGRVVRLCLSLGVIPVFAPPRETGFQAAIESYNGRWQAKVWVRFRHVSLLALQNRSTAYVLEHRARNAARADAAPSRRRFPARWELDLGAVVRGTIVYIRRTNQRGVVDVLGRRFTINRDWVHRLVRGEVDLVRGEVRFYALRRRDPDHQPLLATAPYEFPNRPFRGRPR